MEDPDLLRPDLMEDEDDMEDIDYDLTPEDIAPYTPVPFRRKQHILNITHKVENVMGTHLALTIGFTNKHQRLCRSIEGDVTTIEDKTFPSPYLAGIFSGLLNHKYDANSFCSPIKRHAIIRVIFFFMNLSSLDDDELAKLETHFSLFLLNAMSNSNKEGYTTIHASVELEFATVDTYDEEEVAWAFGLPVPAARACIATLPSQEFNDEAFSNRCSICLDEYSSGITVTQLPCSHDFHRGCVERWLNMSNSCPTCRLPILHHRGCGCVERWLNMSNSCPTPTCRLPI